jgi:hypothetical protein
MFYIRSSDNRLVLAQTAGNGVASNDRISFNISNGEINATGGILSSGGQGDEGFGAGGIVRVNAAGGWGDLVGTTGDTADSYSANLKIRSWNGIGFAPNITGQTVPYGQNALWMNVRTGDFAARGNVVAYASDERLKNNFQPIQNSLDKIQQIAGYEFDWDIDKCRSLGFAPAQAHEHGVKAQEIQKVVADAVTLAPFDDNGGKSRTGENYLTVKYERLVPLLIEAIKELDAKVEELKKKLP